MDYLQQAQAYIDDFSFFTTPLSAFSIPVVGTALYLIVIFSLQAIIKRPHPLKLFTALHNWFLCVLSSAMTIGILMNVIPFATNFGLMHAYCDRVGPQHPHFNMNHGALAFWCFVFYFSKFYEMVDTLLMVLKQRPLTLVHVYHHFIVPYLFWIFLYTDTTGHWSLAFNNSLVHVFMYYYYMMTTLGYTVWWKRYLTMMQIVQFFIDMFATWPHLLFLRAFGIWDCRGSMYAVYFGQAIGISFVYLFTTFYVRSYASTANGKAVENKDEGKLKKVD